MTGPSAGGMWRRVGSFAALGLFVALSWSGMVVDPPFARIALACLPVIAAAALVVPIRRSALGDRAATILAATALVLATLAGIVIAGLPARLLPPGGWGDLGATVDLGFAAIGEGVSYPYDGPSPDSRLLMLIGAPLLVGVAAMFTFLPARFDAAAPRLGGLAVLISGYAMAETMYGPGAPVLRGVILLAGIVAWIWLPLLERRALVGAAALLAVALGAAVPATAQLADSEELIDYKEWSWAEQPIRSFNWEHTYGPIDWERSDETVFFVDGDDPNYWKTSVLDRFDGTRWVNSGIVRDPAELPTSVEGLPASALRDDWFSTAEVSVDRLTSGLIVGPGSGLNVLSGVQAAPSRDGSVVRSAEPLEKGDAYSVSGYTPDPSAEEMRASGWEVPPSLTPYVEILLPPAAGAPPEFVVPLRGGSPIAAGADGKLEASAYSRVAELADRLTDGAPTAYDAVKAVEAHLLQNYVYSEDPPERPLPLESFLFEDRIGYCQQFSGAMALMLRMEGIPARVAAGFSPGVFEGDDRYRVRALDAHTWVEVYFAGIGWVPFDPTPSASPAALRTGGSSAASSAASNLLALLSGAAQPFETGGPDRATDVEGGSADQLADEGGAVAAERSFPTRAVVVLAGIGAALGALIGGPALWRRARERKLGPEAALEARIAELRRALELSPVDVRPSATLLELETALRSRSEPLAGRYVKQLRRLRYGRPGATALPSARERRSLRRRLAEAGGLSARIAALRAIPPLAPRV
ncbi:MAG TPA: transglutaminaseTgpA domain-containing protein [Solirubrobacterales bacterium]|nr:transglutaminaseTgpA domain-containing protein [Solirubrobacterales bacterium]